MEDGEEMVSIFNVRRYGLDSRLEMAVHKSEDRLSGGVKGKKMGQP